MPVRDGPIHTSWTYGGKWNCETRKLKTEGSQGLSNSKDKDGGEGVSRFGGLLQEIYPEFCCTAAPLSDLSRKTATKEVQWNSDCGRAFEKLKSLLCRELVLKCPDFEKPFMLQMDASDRGVGTVLSQLYWGKDHRWCISARSYCPEKRNTQWWRRSV